MVERLGQLTELVLGGDRQTFGQVTVTIRDIPHGAAHLMQRLHQHANQQAQQQDDDDDGNHHGRDGRGAKFAQHGVGRVLIQHQRHIPVSRRHAFNAGQGDDFRFAGRLDLADARDNFRRIGRVSFADIFKHQFAVRVNQNLAATADNEGITMPAEVQGVDGLADAVQGNVGTGHTDKLILVFHRYCQGYHQLARRGGNVRFGHDSARCILGGFVPATGTRVIVCRAIASGHREHHAVCAAEITQLKVIGVSRDADEALQVRDRLAVSRDSLRHGLQ